jgi:hypothetical protein
MIARALTILLALAAGCSEADLSDASFVQGLRLIGVQAEPPEASPGDTVKLTAWVVDTHGGAVDVGWSACLLPSNGLANVGCTDGSGNGLVALGSGETLSIAVPAVGADTLGPPDATLGVYLPIVVHVRAPEDALDTVYRLRIRTAAALNPPNQNPAFDSIDPLGPEDQPSAAHASQVWGLIARYSDGSDQEFKIDPTMNAVPERLTTQWFATAGSFPDQPVGGTAVQKFTIDRALPPRGGTIDLWVVGHDERGGTAMAHRTFVLQ